MRLGIKTGLAGVVLTAGLMAGQVPAGAVTHAYIGDKDCTGLWWNPQAKYQLYTHAAPGDTTHSMTNQNGAWRGGYWAHWSTNRTQTTYSGTQKAYSIYASAYSYFSNIQNICA